VIGWLKEWIGFPEGAGGLLLSGGSSANLTALACARESLIGAMRDDVMAYVSDQSHSSVARAARTLGFRPDQMRVLPTDQEFRMRPDALREAIATDREAGLVPLVVCASAGSTNTGAIDPLDQLAEIAHEHGSWLHVDAAYGGLAALTDRGRRALAGLEKADSVTLDPHKWLYQPFETGCLLVRDGSLLRRAFRIAPDYLQDVDSGQVDFSDLGLQLTRMSRAIKVWLSLSTFGVEAFRAAIDRSMDLALEAQRLIEESDELELMRPAHLGIVCFRRSFGGRPSEVELEELNRRLVAGLDASGVGLVSSTRLHGRYAIRMCVLNHTSGAPDVAAVLNWLSEASVERESGVHPAAEPGGDRQGSVEEAWAGAQEVEAQALGSLPLLATLKPRQLATLAAASHTRWAEAGEEVLKRWARGREFYVVLGGAVEAEVNGEVVRRMGVGNHFGELAAMDWGAGFGYSRLATVRATEPARLLVVPAEVFLRLMEEAPDFASQIKQAVAERLPKS
jgi:glutamate/tyrosine decarboxylase-like PLP-dependent enzyme